MKIYMAVTKDEYQLPLAVADSPTELAQICSVNVSTVNTIVSRWRRGIIQKPRYVYVEIGDEEGGNERALSVMR